MFYNFAYYILLTACSIVYILIIAFAKNELISKKKYGLAALLLFSSWLSIIISDSMLIFGNFGNWYNGSFWFIRLMTNILQFTSLFLLALSFLLVIQSFIGNKKDKEVNTSN